jgi:hypothetical protein
MNLRRLVYILLILILLAGMLPVLALAQDYDPQLETTATPEEVIPRRDIPGDTLGPLLVAGFLVLIVLGGVLWRSKSK